MGKAILAFLLLLHGIVTNRMPAAGSGGVAPAPTIFLPVLVTVTLASALLRGAAAEERHKPAIRSETLIQTGSSWDGEPYQSYPSGQPELSVLKIILAPHTQLEWHSHPMPSAAYIVAGELTVERKKDRKKERFTAGEAVSETVDTLHRGVAGTEPVVLIVFYAGSPGMPLN